MWKVTASFYESDRIWPRLSIFGKRIQIDTADITIDFTKAIKIMT